MQTLHLTKNECYIVGRRMTPRGIMVHSTGANNPNLRRYVGPDDGILGHNPNGNHWNVYHPGGRDIGPHRFVRDRSGRCATCGGRQVCVHAFIGRDKNGKARVYQTLPWDMQGWHAGGSANSDHIGFEICEDGLTDRAYFNEVYAEAVGLCAYLCRLYPTIPNADIIGHFEGHQRGIASNHADPEHWFRRHGKSMVIFRADVAAALKVSQPEPTPVPTPPQPPSHTGPRILYRVIIDGTQCHALSTQQAAQDAVIDYIIKGQGKSGEVRRSTDNALLFTCPRRGIVTARSGLIVRAGIGTVHPRVTAYPFDACIDIIETRDGWHRTKDGWVSGEWVRLV